MARWHSCNVLHVGAAARRIWQFDARNGSFSLNREQVSRAGEPLPSKLFSKGWGSIFQKKLNVAWLPPENVFIRVAQFPQSTPEETRSMVELQLEKLSPIPVTQAVWMMHILPAQPLARRTEPASTEVVSAGPTNLQTVVVVIAQRNVVEEFLGQLEGQGYMADRLELPLLDQLQGAVITEDGAWIYPGAQGGDDTALVAWWYGGVLQNVDLLTRSAGPDKAANLKDQLMQMAWAGELEGWLTAPPRWHLVADDATAAEWVTLLQQGLEQLIEVVPPLSTQELAARTAQRSTQADAKTNLLPVEFAARYRRQFEDRLWLRGLGCAVALYVIAVIIYFIASGVVNYQLTAAETRLAGQGDSYTNAIQTKMQYKILLERNDLRFAGLDCWEAIAESLPENVTLESMNFSDGRKLSLTGTAAAGQTKAVVEFCEKLRRHVLPPKGNQPGQQLFLLGNEVPNITVGQAGAIRWTYSLELRRSEK